MRFLTWNIQRGGGRRLSAIVREIARLQPDVVGLTEVTSRNLAVLRESLIREGFDHVVTTCAEGNDNSVLVASKLPFVMSDDQVVHDQERWLAVELEGVDVKVLCVHIPGGTDNKFDTDGTGVSGKKRKEMLWDEVIRYARRHRGERTILLGDFNTGLAEDAQGTPFVLSDYMRVLRLEKYVDTWRSLNPHGREFTWYTRRKNTETGNSEDYNGFRLDYVFVSPALSGQIIDARHVHDVRTSKVSDHAMVIANISVPGEEEFRSLVDDLHAADVTAIVTATAPNSRSAAARDTSSDSLVAALTKTRIPVSNHDFIRRFTAAVGIDSFRAVERADRPYVIAKRRNNLPDLHIYYGYTTGFTSEDEIVRVAGADAGRAPSSRTGTWYVKHPTNQVRPSGRRVRHTRQEAGFCACGMQLSLTGACGTCH